MRRIQVQLTDDQLQGLRRASVSTGQSTSGLVREGVDLYLRSRRQLSREELRQRALRVAGRFASGSRDGSAEHDRHITDAFGA